MTVELYIAQERWQEVIINYVKLKTKTMKIKTTKVIVPANEVLGEPEKTLYYLVLINEKKNKQHKISIGEKTYNTINDLGDILDDGKLNKSNQKDK